MHNLLLGWGWGPGLRPLNLNADIYFSGKLKHAELDERALDALKEFAPNDAIQVLKQVIESNLGHVTNKSAYLCGQMKTYRQKMKSGTANAAPKGPDEAKLKVCCQILGQALIKMAVFCCH